MNTSIEHLPHNIKEELNRLVEIIRDTIICEKIILYGSYARGNYVRRDVKFVNSIANEYRSDFDILVITENEVEKVRKIQKEKDISDKFKEYYGGPYLSTPVHFLTESINDVNEYIKNSNFIFVDIYQQGIVLYDTGKYYLAEPRELTVEERENNARVVYNELYTSACNFMEVSNYLSQKGQYKDALHLLHKSCELFLKTIIQVHTNYNPKTHEIDELLEIIKVIQKKNDITTIAGILTELKLNPNEAELLRKAYIDSLYNQSSFNIQESELLELLKKVNIFSSCTQQACGLLIEFFVSQTKKSVNTQHLGSNLK